MRLLTGQGCGKEIDNFFPTSTDRQEVSQNTKITLDVTQKSCQLTNNVATCVVLSKVEQTIIVHKVGLVSFLTFNSFWKFFFLTNLTKLSPKTQYKILHKNYYQSRCDASMQILYLMI